MRLRLKKLNTNGVAHHFLIALVAVTMVASFGAYKVFFSKASTGNVVHPSVAFVGGTSQDTNGGGCSLAGRKWDASAKKCTTTCLDASASVKYHAEGYCDGSVYYDPAGQATCTKQGRVFINNLGCSRLVSQKDVAGVLQCINSSNTYYGTAANDFCAPAACQTKVGAASCAPTDAEIASAQTACQTAHKAYNATTNTCGACSTGYTTTQTGSCTNALDASLQAQTTCNNAHNPWTPTTKTCDTKSCVPGYTMNASKVCVSSDPTVAAQQACDASHKLWDATKKTCSTNACATGYQPSAANVTPFTCTKSSTTSGGNSPAGCTGDLVVVDGVCNCPVGKQLVRGSTSKCENGTAPIAACDVGVLYDTTTHTCANGKAPVLTCTLPQVKSGDYCVVPATPAVADPSGFKITVYDKVNFQGNSKTFTAEVPDLKAAGWDNKISSYRVQGGHWKLC